METVKLKFDENGLIPAVVQNRTTKEVLMVAYMNEDTLNKTVETKRATFWSRSRGEVWVKGETSGNYLYVQDILVDCDGDCLVIMVDPAGPACHTGHRSCFYRRLDGEEYMPTESENDILRRIWSVTEDRKRHPKEGSYTNYLFNKGEDKILKKVGEEAAEVVIAGKNRSREEISYEAADLLYHMTVMLSDNDMSWDDVFRELERRR